MFCGPSPDHLSCLNSKSFEVFLEITINNLRQPFHNVIIIPFYPETNKALDKKVFQIFMWNKKSILGEIKRAF